MNSISTITCRTFLIIILRTIRNIWIAFFFLIRLVKISCAILTYFVIKIIKTIRNKFFYANLNCTIEWLQLIGTCTLSTSILGLSIAIIELFPALSIDIWSQAFFTIIRYRCNTCSDTYTCLTILIRGIIFITIWNLIIAICWSYSLTITISCLCICFL
jgi:hypothetical protein